MGATAQKPIRGELLKVSEVAKMFKMCPTAIYEMAKTGKLPSHKIGTDSIRFDSADVDDYLFFSKFNGTSLSLSSLDKRTILERIAEQEAHFKKYIEKFMKEAV